MSHAYTLELTKNNKKKARWLVALNSRCEYELFIQFLAPIESGLESLLDRTVYCEHRIMQQKAYVFNF